ncbi:TonB-dependent receptor [Luteimonas sp. 3794]|uniref:TonB-dependent receptor plug domain-containing protein n=1 Tax=Luteimonas sp. 3794 TaxID=2817730 RepID=UPI00285749CD|nr:TonB-dependent receptor [Luteimonas sp. 3794]MDR6990186.1 iron complex outermembrane receptor protein [Luteimonas sp. 3794]
MKPTHLACAVIAALSMSFVSAAASAAPATPTSSTSDLDAVIVTGTRGSTRTQFDTMVPIDVFTEEDVRRVESSDVNDILAQLVPSFVVQRLPMADGQVFVRPATLRSLSPDHTLVLVNGRRFHRSAMLGGRGAQAPDLSQIPASAIKRIEVLRDGAAAQYGSDAIAGVINIILDNSTGGSAALNLSEYSEGDGTAWSAEFGYGFTLGDAGVLRLFGERGSSDPTSRSRQRPDAIAFQAAHPELDVPDPVQRWGQPELEHTRLGFNLELGLGETTTLYGHGLYGESDGLSDFNWRNPDTNSELYRQTPVFPGWDLRTVYPVGFSPAYGNESQDLQLLAGLRGMLGDALDWDASVSHGRSSIDYTLANSINGSLGPDSPTAFYLGNLEQKETNLNLDFVYQWALPALDAPVNVAFGAEHRKETYAVSQGDAASWAVGPGAAAGLAPNASGAPGFSAAQAGSWGQTSNAAYVDVEVPLGARFALGGALRYEDFSEFGDTLNGKLSARWELADGLALRGAWSTGFRAPTPGQLYSTSTTQGLDTVTLLVFNTGRLSPDDPIARSLGAQALRPEESESATMGLAWQGAAGFSGSLDVYRIAVDDRFSSSPSQVVPANLPNPMRYTSVYWFTNDFDTVTRGVDLVAHHRSRATYGELGLTLAWNHNKTEVASGSTGVATNPNQRRVFEERLPRNKGSFTASLSQERWDWMARARYYGAWTDSTGNATGEIFQTFGDMLMFDVAATWNMSETLSLRLGADNVFNRYPDEAVFQASRGLIYSRNAPYDTDGRNVSARLRLEF